MTLTREQEKAMFAKYKLVKLLSGKKLILAVQKDEPNKLVGMEVNIKGDKILRKFDGKPKQVQHIISKSAIMSELPLYESKHCVLRPLPPETSITKIPGGVRVHLINLTPEMQVKKKELVSNIQAVLGDYLFSGCTADELCFFDVNIEDMPKGQRFSYLRDFWKAIKEWDYI